MGLGKIFSGIPDQAACLKLKIQAQRENLPQNPRSREIEMDMPTSVPGFCVCPYREMQTDTAYMSPAPPRASETSYTLACESFQSCPGLWDWSLPVSSHLPKLAKNGKSQIVSLRQGACFCKQRTPLQMGTDCPLNDKNFNFRRETVLR